MSEKYIIKILTLGDSLVGKTSIVLRYSDNKFLANQSSLSTIGIDFKIKRINKGGESIKVSIYDTAGQERYQNLIKNYYRGANGVLLVYDITNPTSFKKLQFWLDDLKENADKFEDLYICLIGNKIDLEDKRKITKEDAKKFAKENNFPYFEVSAKTGDGVKHLFDDVIKGSMTKMLKSSNRPNSENNLRLSFLDKEEIQPKNKMCC